MKHFCWFLIIMVCMVSPGLAAGSADAGQGSFSYKDMGKRDPFWPLVTENGSIISYDEQDLMASDMVLQGIMVGDDENVAIINGKIVKKGDMIGTFKVEGVMPTIVVLGNGKEKIELHLRKEE